MNIKSKKLDEDISRRIWITRYFMIIGIIVLHLPPYQPLNEAGNSFFDYIKAFFSHGVFRATVPLLTTISGYLTFKLGLHYYPMRLLLNKISSLLIPLLLWNIPIAIAVFLIQKYDLSSHVFSLKLYPIDTLSWINSVTGLYESPINYPLNFLRDLFVVSLFSILFWQLLKRIPYTGLLIVFFIYYFNLDGQLVLRNSMLISFYLGALLAHKNFDLKKLDQYSILCLSLFLFLCFIIVEYRIENREIFRIISPFLVWPAMSIISSCKVGNYLYKYSGSSFFTFLSHGPIILVLFIIFNKTNLPYFIYWISAPLLTVIISIILYNLLKSRAPMIASILLGNR